MVVRYHPLAHWRRQERHLRLLDEAPYLLLSPRPGRAFADDGEGITGGTQRRQRFFHHRRVDLGRGGGFDAWRVLEFLLVNPTSNDIARQVQVDRSRPPRNGVAHGRGNIAWNQFDALSLPHPFGEGAGQFYLWGGLEVAHVVEGLVGRPANEQHGPAVRPGIAERRDGIGHAWSRDHNTGPDPPLEIRDRLRRIAGGLLMARTNISDTFARRCRRNPRDRDADHPKEFVNALLLQTPRH